jgi:hypothetical protein
LLTGDDLVFGWRLELKHLLISSRISLASERPEQAMAEADSLAERAGALGVPRYGSTARVMRHLAGRALGLPADLDRLAADLDAVDGSVAIEAWRLTGEVAAHFVSPAFLDLAEWRAAKLAGNGGP